MKTSFTYVLIFIFGLQSLGMNAIHIANFSNLITHYQHHKSDHQDSFLEFIDLHYGSQQQAHSNEHDEHEDLPFNEDSFFLISTYFESPKLLEFKFIHPFTPKKNIFSYLASSSHLHSTDILHPPKHLIDFRS